MKKENYFKFYIALFGLHLHLNHSWSQRMTSSSTINRPFLPLGYLWALSLFPTVSLSIAVLLQYFQYIDKNSSLLAQDAKFLKILNFSVS